MNKYLLKQKPKHIKILFLLIPIVGIIMLLTGSAAAQGLPVLRSGLINLPGGVLTGGIFQSNTTNKKTLPSNPLSASFSYSKSMKSQIQITTGSLSNSTSISPLVYGANEVWYNGGFGAQNLSNYQLYPKVIDLIKSIGVSIIRYPGGIPSDSFHWENAIGPQNKRVNNPIYYAEDDFLPSSFGPDEFGQLLDATNSEGDITVNFGTGTAQEAANWVQYMTASSKNNYWGELRAQNGHPAPYNVPIWEVGNETEASSGENYWRSGAVVSIDGKTDIYSVCHDYDTRLCEYVYGGVTSFARQPALAANNDSGGDGKPNQIFYIKYPPVSPNSQSVYISGVLWHQVNSIASAGAGADVYQLNNVTGQLTFGDGLHGAVVPKNASVSASYLSGPHDGFLEYYKLMKAADPGAQICSSYQSTDFVQLMGANNPYDCLVVHLYAGEIPSTNSSTSLFHNSLISQSYNLIGSLTSEQNAINKYAGNRAKDIKINVTEYGINASTYPVGQPSYHLSQDSALFMANLLREIIESHVEVAEKHYLISYQNAQPPSPIGFFNSSIFSDNAMIGGPGQSSILQPTAYVLQEYSKLLYSNLISSNVSNNPQVVYSGGNYPILSTIATTDSSGNEAIMVINLSMSRNIKAEVEPSINSYKYLKSWTLGAKSVLSYNTQSNPNAVKLVNDSTALYKGRAIATFPAGSVTVLQLYK